MTTPIICGIVGGTLLLAFIIWFCYFSNNVIQVSSYDINLNVGREYKIVHLSDLHGKSFGVYHQRLINKVIAASPDYIVLTGDAIHLYRERDIEVAISVLSMCLEIAPVLYVAGNHEMRSTKYRQFRQRLSSIGVTVLDDRCFRCEGMCFVGINCANQKNNTLEGITPDDSVKILLAHKPKDMDRYERLGYSLVLSGHAHGGQFMFPFTRKGVYAPDQGLFPKYVCGMYEKGNTKMIVSRGLGNSQFPLRLFNRPEVIYITVR